MTDRITKFINSLDQKTKARLKEKLFKVREKPYSTLGVKKLRGYKNRFRFRIGKIRIIYTIKNSKIDIIDIDYRGNIY